MKIIGESMPSDQLLVKHTMKKIKAPKARKPKKAYKFTDLTSQQGEALDWYLRSVEQKHGMNSHQYRSAKKKVDNILIRNKKKIRPQKAILKDIGKTTVKVIEQDSLYGELKNVPSGTEPETVKRYNRELEALYKQYKRRR